MTLRINTNIAALNAHQQMMRTDTSLSSSLVRLSTGLRITKAADDASGMVIADKIRSQTESLKQASRNVADASSIIQVADGALQESINIVNTIKTKAIQAATDGQNTVTRKAIQNDINKLLEELDTIAQTTSFNGQKLLSGAFKNKAIQIGAYGNETLNIDIGSTEISKIGHIKKGELNLSGNSGGPTQLVITSAITGEQITLNSIDIQYDNNREHSMGALADEVSRYASITGIKATAIVSTQTDQAIKSGKTGEDFTINGIKIGAITVSDNDADNALVNSINNKTTETGVQASIDHDGSLILSSIDQRSIKVEGNVSDTFGGTTAQMSTYGYLSLTQQGASQFSIDGIGGEAVGGEFNISGDMTTVEDSILTSGSVIDAGSMITAGSLIGGKTRVESLVDSSGSKIRLTSGSILGHGSTIAKGTILSGSVIISGDTQDAAETGLSSIKQDMVLSAGSVLKKHSVIGSGSNITFNFSANGVSYKAGDILTSAVTLDSDVTISNNMVLAYNSNTDKNSKIKAGSTLSSESTAGTSFNIGDTRDSTAAALTLVASGAGSTTTTTDLFLNGADVTLQGSFTFKNGTMLADGSSILLDNGGWDGPTLITTNGTLEKGDTISDISLYTISGDQVLSEDMTTYSLSTADQTIKAGSILTAGFEMEDKDGGFENNANFISASINDATINKEMDLVAGSSLQAGTILMANSILGDNTYIDGGVDSNGNSLDFETTGKTILKAGSTLEDGSMLARGSTIGGTANIQNNFDLKDDMTIKSGSTLSSGTVLKKGTIISQDMDLYQAKTANIAVNYGTGFSENAEAKDAFEFAASIWEGLLDSSIDIAIDASLATLGTGVLGGAYANGQELGSNITGAAQSGANYAMALANSIDGVDHNGATSEIVAEFTNDSSIDWYYGTDGKGQPGQYDFVSVVMHEIGHGLGFFSNTTSTGALTSGTPAIYDFFINDATTGDNFSDGGETNAEREAAATSGNISWDGTNGVTANGGTNPTLYAPGTWGVGSSVSHLDETTFNSTQNSLMTPSIGTNEIAYNPGAVALGMMKDMGWDDYLGGISSLKAGDTLSEDLEVGISGLTLSNDMTLKTGSSIYVNSSLNVNSGLMAVSNQTTSNLSQLNVLDNESAQLAIEISESALSALDTQRAALGSKQNQLASTYTNIGTMVYNLSASESIIRDVDFADEATNFSKLSLLQETGAFAMRSATLSSSYVLTLLQ
ncbi:MAG: hypothetical protein GY699_00580 [Desulfobacteraceae bacterium]|nr:hypothetical protein [Desulfobacteraceae bacterium]